MCTYCGRYIDNAEHTLMECEEWNTERDNMKTAINKAINIENIIRAICSSEETWLAVNSFAQFVMGRKEEDEKEKQRKRERERQDRRGEFGGVQDRERNSVCDTDSGPGLYETDEENEMNLGNSPNN